MSIERSKEKDYKSLSTPSKAGDKPTNGPQSLRPSGAANDATASDTQKPVNLNYTYAADGDVSPLPSENAAAIGISVEPIVIDESPLGEHKTAQDPTDGKSPKKARQEEKGRRRLGRDRWLVRNGHLLTYFGLYLFSILVLFRPYELVPGLGFLSATSFYFAAATLAIYLPSQLVTEGNLTMLSTEVKAILALTLIALLTVPIAKDPGTAWETFNDPYIKAVLIFIVLVNVVRTRRRLMAMMWLSLGIGVYLSYSAMDLYLSGKFVVEEYRVAVDIKGMFGNPNEMSLHFVMMIPLAITLCIGSKTKLMRVIYLAMSVLFIAANMVTYSRDGFLGILAAAAVLVWKLGRKNRMSVTIDRKSVV